LGHGGRADCEESQSSPHRRRTCGTDDTAATTVAEPQALTVESRPELSATTVAEEPVAAQIEEEAPAEAGLVDITNILGAPTVTVVRSSM
jgi:hypothetical protein